MTTKFAPLFAYEEDEPRISAYRKNDLEYKISNEIKNGNVSENMVIDCIEHGWTSNALKVSAFLNHC